MAATGKVGAGVSPEDGARLRASVRAERAGRVDALVGLDAVVRVVKVVGFVASDPSFTGQPQVVNGACELLGEIFGEPASTPARRSASRAAAGRPGRGRAHRRGRRMTDADDVRSRRVDRRSAARRHRRARGVAADPGDRRWSSPAGMAVFPGGRVDDADADLPFAGGVGRAGRAPGSSARPNRPGRSSARRCARRSKRPGCCSPCRPPTCPARAPTSRPAGSSFGDLLRANGLAVDGDGAAPVVALGHPGRRGAPLRHAVLRRRAARGCAGAGRHDRVVVGGLVRRRRGARVGAARRDRDAAADDHDAGLAGRLRHGGRGARRRRPTLARARCVRSSTRDADGGYLAEAAGRHGVRHCPSSLFPQDELAYEQVRAGDAAVRPSCGNATPAR